MKTMLKVSTFYSYVNIIWKSVKLFWMAQKWTVLSRRRKLTEPEPEAESDENSYEKDLILLDRIDAWNVLTRLTLFAEDDKFKASKN